MAKLERHLSLLRQEYVKLQNKLVDLEQKYSVAVAASGQTGEHENTFVSRLLKTVAELFDKDLYRCKGPLQLCLLSWPRLFERLIMLSTGQITTHYAAFEQLEPFLF